MNISTGYNTPIVSMADSMADPKSRERVEARLSIFNLQTQRREGDFLVRYDIGGRRLSLSRDSLFCFVGCYKTYGIAAYSALDSSEIWRRKDLKAVQYVKAFPFDDYVFCGREGAGHLLCAKTGRTLEKPRGVKAVYPSPFSRHVLVSTRTLDVHSTFGTPIGKIERTTFAELDGCFSDAEVLITESTGPLRCFDLASLELLWTHTLPGNNPYFNVPGDHNHFFNLTFSRPLDCFLGIRWDCIVHFERRTGRVLREVPLGGRAGEFCLEGTTVFTTDLCLISAETGYVICEFTGSDKPSKVT